MRPIAVAGRWSMLGLAVCLAAGCGGAPATHPVKGTILFDRGDVRLLAGGSLICQNQQDPLIQATGDIAEDGSFELQTNWKGKVLPGAVAGDYRAWITLPTEDGSEQHHFRKIGIDPLFLAGTSPLVIRVPAEQEVVLNVTRARPGAALPTGDEQPLALGLPCSNETETKCKEE